MTTPMTLRKVQKSAQQPETSNDYLPEIKEKKPQPLSFRKIKKAPSFTGNEDYEHYLRTGLQIPQGLAEVTAPGLIASAWQLLGQGEVLDPEEIEHIKAISEREGIPFDEEKYMEAAQNALKYIPTVSNVAREIEEKTGLPLEAKTDLQKGTRFASSLGKITPGTIGQKAVGIGAGLATKAGLEHAGVPEFLSELGGFGAAGLAGSKAPKIDIAKSKKPSGLTTRQFEKLQKPVEVSAKKIKQIDEKLESDFRDIASDIIEKSPINETHSELKNDVSFKLAAEEAFEKVDKLAERITEKVSLDDLKKDLIKRGAEEKKSGITELEFDKEYNKNIKQFVKDTKGKEASLSGIIKQYRKNNEAYGKSWESGKSTDYNVAKREALLDYNRTIADTIEKKFPDTEFSNLFKSSNEQWKKIMDAEAIDAYVNDIFKGKINYKKNGEFFNKKQKQIFKRALGEEGYKNFEQLNKDFMSTEKAYKMMKVAEEKGYSDLAKTGISYLIHPKLAATKVGIGMVKGAYKALWQSLLDKPQLAVTWDKGIKAFQKGDFATAEKQFNKMEESRVESLKKFKENKSNKTIGIKELEPAKPVKKSDANIEEVKLQEGRDFRDRFMEKPTAQNMSERNAKEAKLKSKVDKKTAPKIDWKAVEKTLDEIHARDYKEPIPTPEVLKEKLPEIKRQDISKSGLKNQKEFILSNLEDAIANPDNFKNEKYINLSVPGDGEFKIKNDPKALAQFYKSVKSKWPDKPLKKAKRSKDIEYPDYAYKEHEIKAEKERNDYFNSQKDPSLPNRKKRKK